MQVYGNPGESDWGPDEAGVEWYPFWWYDESNRPAVFVIWWHHLDAVCRSHRPYSEDEECMWCNASVSDLV